MQKPTNINYWVLLALFAVIFVATATGMVFNLLTNSAVNAKVAQQKEEARPANLEMTIIQDSNCKECFDITKVITSLEKLNIKITKKNFIERTNDEGKALIEKYQIKKVPMFILTGEINKGNDLKAALSKTGTTQNDVFIYELKSGPYAVATTGEIKGKTNLLLIADVTCANCYDVTQHEIILSQFGLFPQSKVVDAKSAEGKKAINKYFIKQIPTFVLTGDVNEYPGLKSIWNEVGTIERDGAYVFRQGVPFMGIYKEVVTGKIIDPSKK